VKNVRVFQPSCAFAAYRARRAALKFSPIRRHSFGGGSSFVKPSVVGSEELGVQESYGLFVIVRYYLFMVFIFAGFFRLYHGTLRLTDTRELPAEREIIKKMKSRVRKTR
jgi:hypothetical protein